MQLGVHVASFSWDREPQLMAETLAGIARATEQSGCSSLSFMDHFFQLPMLGDAAAEPMLEGYTALGFVAGVTSSIHIHLLVGGVTYRHPGVLAKTVSTLDVLSAGRAGFGIGAAWFDREHEGLGVPFPSTSERFERLEETLQICKQMWGPDDGPYQGRHYRLAETIDRPGPVQRPHPPIMVGGGGEKKTLRLVAKYADACNLGIGPNPDEGHEEVAHKLRVLADHCAREGTDYDRIEKTILFVGLAGPTPELRSAFVEAMRRYRDLGIDRVMVVPIGDDPVGFVRSLETAADQLASL